MKAVRHSIVLLMAIAAALIVLPEPPKFVPEASAHEPLCTQTGFTALNCGVGHPGIAGYFTGFQPMGTSIQFFTQAPICDCVPDPIHGTAMFCAPRQRVANAKDNDHPPIVSGGITYKKLYCGASSGLHLHRR